jgi:hypothetical protein
MTQGHVAALILRVFAQVEGFELWIMLAGAADQLRWSTPVASMSTGNVIETHDHVGELKERWIFTRITSHLLLK